MTYPDGTPYTETDTRTKLINPGLYDVGWTEDHIQRERSPGAVLVDSSGRGKRDTERVDDLLCLPIRDSQIPLPIGVIEAKAADKPYKLGLQQAKDYARRLNVPFVFSSNGFRCSFYNDFTGITLDIDLINFPSPWDLRQIYEEKTGIHLDSAEAQALLAPYRGGLSARRYYQDAAIRASLEKIARGENRILISMATGTGKTLTAVHLLRKLADVGQVRRVLFVCDRTSLAEQAHATLSRFFGDDAQIVTGRNPQKNARILVATYQTLNVGGDPLEEGEARHDGKFFLEHYAENEFDVVVIDECHRSAWGQWSIVLTRNSAATHIGLTATPRILAGGSAAERTEDEQITASNVAYFGEPVYEYTIAQAQADGYLAAAEIIKRISSLDQLGGLTREELAAKRPVDPITGAPLSADDLEELYTNRDYNRILILPDLVRAMCEDFFTLLCERGDPHQKTIIFCARDSHADDVATALNNSYARWCAENGIARRDEYAFKLTSAAHRPDDLLRELRGAGRSHYIATTVDLLSTGIDVPWLENIIFFTYIGSPIRFYQMLGSGTRIAEGKLTFRIYDYTDASRLLGEDFITQARHARLPRAARESLDAETLSDRRRREVQVEGFAVTVDEIGHYIMIERDGKETAVSVEEYEQELARRLLPLAPTLDDLRQKWTDPAERKELLDALPRRANGARVLQALKNQQDYDLYDVLADAVYHAAPKRRLDRAYDFRHKQRTWLQALGRPAERVLLALVERFADEGSRSWRTNMSGAPPPSSAPGARQPCRGRALCRRRCWPRPSAGCSRRRRGVSSPNEAGPTANGAETGRPRMGPRIHE
jgi:type I restriction enzyme R subunit